MPVALAPLVPPPATTARVVPAGPPIEPLLGELLGDIVAGLAAAPDLWRPHAHHDSEQRRPVRLLASGAWETWVIGWTAGQHVELHDHGDSVGALVVLEGELIELTRRRSGALVRRELRPGPAHALPAGLVHDVVAPGPRPATSLHVYSPPLRSMRFYDGRGVVTRTVEVLEEAPVAGAGGARALGFDPAVVTEASGIDRLLARTRAGLDRVDPADLGAEVEGGALVVDIRPEADRRTDGELAGALVVERIHLEWRLDPSSAHRVPEATPGRRMIVVCNEGYASSLAADTLRQLGVPLALAGGYRAWRALRP